MLFSQVREDPLVEFSVVQKLIKQNEDQKLKISCITSGGCTILSLLEFEKIEQIDCVDINPAQNYLTALKIAVCEYFSNSKDVLDFFQGKLTKDSYEETVNKFVLQQDVKAYWEKHKEEIYKGFNQRGKFEELFRELVRSKFDFNTVFDRNYLIKIFGENAVQNSKDREFYDHFEQVIKLYQRMYKPDENYFYHQILFDSYDSSSDKKVSLPPYLLDENLNKRIIAVNKTKLKFKVANYVEHIKESKTGYYDMIHTSNITDWMAKEELADFIKELHRSLSSNGYVIMRRLMGDYKLTEYLKGLFEINNLVDRSHFYSEVIIAKKCSE
jgi:S-adenosylmethionine:diacylglycerol 3-amino-3-carboxypropyl transferase